MTNRIDKEWIYPFSSACIIFISSIFPIVGSISVQWSSIASIFTGKVKLELLWLFGFYFSLDTISSSPLIMQFLTSRENFWVINITCSLIIIILGIWLFSLSISIKRKGISERYNKIWFLIIFLLLITILEWCGGVFFFDFKESSLDLFPYGDFWENLKPIGILGLIFSILISFIGLKKHRISESNQSKIFIVIGILLLIAPLFPSATSHDLYFKYVWMFGLEMTVITNDAILLLDATVPMISCILMIFIGFLFIISSITQKKLKHDHIKILRSILTIYIFFILIVYIIWMDFRILFIDNIPTTLNPFWTEWMMNFGLILPFSCGFLSVFAISI